MNTKFDNPNIQVMKIRKAKLAKGGTVEATFIDDEGNEIAFKGKNVAHNDLRTRLSALVPYFADLTEQKEAESIDWLNLDSEENSKLLDKLEVRGVTIGGDDTMPIAVMSGCRTLMTSKVLNLNTPATDLNADDSGWMYADDFRDAIDAFFYEVELYIRDRKWAVKQSEFNFDEDCEDPFDEPTPTEEVEPFSIPA